MPPPPLMICGKLGAGKTEHAAKLIATCLATHSSRSILAVSGLSRSTLHVRADMLHDSYSNLAHVDTPLSLARRMIESPFAAMVDGKELARSHIDFGFAERCMFMESILYRLPLSKFRPDTNPTGFVSRLVLYFNRLVRADVSPEAYRNWISRQTTPPGDHVVELCNVYDELWQIKNEQGRYDPDDVVYLASRLTREALRDDTSQDLKGLFFPELQKDEHHQLLVVDDAHLLSPAAARFVWNVATVTNRQNEMILLGDWAPDSPVNTAARKNFDYFLHVLGPDKVKTQGLVQYKLVDLPSSAAADTTQPLVPQCLTPLNTATLQSEIDSLTEFINTHPTQRIAIVTRYQTDRDTVAANLTARGHHVSCIGRRESVFATPEVRIMRAFLVATCEAGHDTSDAELFFLLTHPMLPYSPSPEQIKTLSSEKYKTRCNMRTALNLIPAGKVLLAHLQEIENTLASGASTSQTCATVLRASGLAKRLENPTSPEDMVSAHRLARFLELIVKVETNNMPELAGMKPGAVPMDKHHIRIMSVFGRLERLTELGWSEVMESVGLPHGGGGEEEEEEEEENLTSDRQERVSVSSMHTLSGGYGHGTRPDFVIVARATDTKIPGRRRPAGIPLPVDLVCRARVEDDIGDEGPFPQIEEEIDHTDKERTILNQALSRATMGTFFSYDVHKGERPSRLLVGGSAATKKRHYSTYANQRRRYLGTTTTPTRSPPVIDVEEETRDDPAMEEPTGTLHLSYSSLRDYEMCPKRFYLKRHVGLQTPSNPPAAYGKSLHAGLAAYLDPQQEIPIGSTRLDVAKAAFTNLFQETCVRLEGFHCKAQYDALLKNGVQIITDFCVRNAHRLSNVVKVEHPFTFRGWEGQSNIELVGVIDLIENLPNGKRRVVDFKSNMLDMTKLKRLARSNAQLAVYALAYEREFGTRPDFVSVESIETGACVQVVPSMELEMTIKDRIVAVARGRREEKFDALPSAGNCMFCEFRKTCVESVYAQ